jgi:hypothetical protein
MQKPAIKIIHAGRLIDAVSDEVRTDVSVTVENDRIREVQNGKITIEGADVIDLSDSTVMPGLRPTLTARAASMTPCVRESTRSSMARIWTMKR